MTTHPADTSEHLGPLRVGLLAYGAIGHEHNLAVQSTPGLELSAVCDTNPDRVLAARELAPLVTGFTNATDMLDSGLVDVVVISTPPNSHYSWAKESLERGIHVVLEKPMALTTAESDELLDLAESRGVTLVVYQNRRFDQDFVTMRRLINEGAIGTPFVFESFVGGYGRPCDYWHSMADVSGGAIFDWGSHYLDQLLNLFESQIDYVTGNNHKRHWHHVTNADHAEVRVVFTDGLTARFVNSDLAAARQPKFYVLGTHGAIVAQWNPDAEPAVADLPAEIFLYSDNGTSTPIPLDDVAPFQFHKELAEHIISGTPMQVNAHGSRDVVALMEAAELSASRNGLPEKVQMITRPESIPRSESVA